jgi:hypothetical protein
MTVRHVSWYPFFIPMRMASLYEFVALPFVVSRVNDMIQ